MTTHPTDLRGRPYLGNRRAVTEHSTITAAIQRTVESWLLDGPDIPGETDSRAQRLAGAYRIITVTADERHIPAATVRAALESCVRARLITHAEARGFFAA